MPFWRGVWAAAAWAWVGVILFYLFGVTTPIFHLFGDEAGRLLAGLFPSFYRFGAFAGAIALIAAALTVRQLGRYSQRRLRRANWPVVALAIAWVANAVGGWGVEPKVHALATSTDVEAFGLWHGLAMLLSLICLLAAAAAGSAALARARR